MSREYGCSEASCDAGSLGSKGSLFKPAAPLEPENQLGPGQPHHDQEAGVLVDGPWPLWGLTDTSRNLLLEAGGRSSARCGQCNRQRAVDAEPLARGLSAAHASAGTACAIWVPLPHLGVDEALTQSCGGIGRASDVAPSQRRCSRPPDRSTQLNATLKPPAFQTAANPNPSVAATYLCICQDNLRLLRHASREVEVRRGQATACALPEHALAG
jgi:hypothetical protein